MEKRICENCGKEYEYPDTMGLSAVPVYWIDKHCGLGCYGEALTKAKIKAEQEQKDKEDKRLKEIVKLVLVEAGVING